MVVPFTITKETKKIPEARKSKKFKKKRLKDKQMNTKHNIENINTEQHGPISGDPEGNKYPAPYVPLVVLLIAVQTRL